MNTWYEALSKQYTEGFIKRLMHAIRCTVRTLTQGSDLEDACQDCLISLFEGKDTFRVGGEREYLAWAKRVAANLMISCYRQRTRRTRLQRKIFQDGLELEPHRHLSQIRTFEDRVDACLLAPLLEQLPERQRRMILLAAVGATYEEIATQLGCPVGTVMSSLYRARSRLQRILTKARDLVAA